VCVCVWENVLVSVCVCVCINKGVQWCGHVYELIRISNHTSTCFLSHTLIYTYNTHSLSLLCQLFHWIGWLIDIHTHSKHTHTHTHTYIHTYIHINTPYIRWIHTRTHLFPLLRQLFCWFRRQIDGSATYHVQSWLVFALLWVCGGGLWRVGYGMCMYVRGVWYEECVWWAVWRTSMCMWCVW
jgi:hypothetical protein